VSHIKGVDLGLTFNPQTQPTKILSITFSFTIYSLIVVDRFEAKNTDYPTLFFWIVDISSSGANWRWRMV